MKVAGETWQRSQQTSPAAGSYIQPWLESKQSWAVVAPQLKGDHEFGQKFFVITLRSPWPLCLLY